MPNHEDGTSAIGRTGARALTSAAMSYQERLSAAADILARAILRQMTTASRKRVNKKTPNRKRGGRP